MFADKKKIITFAGKFENYKKENVCIGHLN